MIETKTTAYGSKLTKITPADELYGATDYTIRDADGTFVASLTVTGEGRIFICGHNVEISKD
tara:strand:- start:519 stop:704 length:186 start_codon:yes stop_codon:yes gene_type:complete